MITVMNKGISPLETGPVFALACMFHRAGSIIHGSVFKLWIYMPIWPFTSLPPLSVNLGKCLQIQLNFFFCSFSCMPYFLKGTKIFSSLPLKFWVFIYTYYLFGTVPQAILLTGLWLYLGIRFFRKVAVVVVESLVCDMRCSKFFSFVN